jgi:tRNA nucleotidyltransferase (CCA-adding enzyme)
MKTIKIPGKVYQVGGSIRDRLLGLPHHEADYVVIGTTPEAMTAAGFIPVGKNFPVFLHPQTHEEYALARTERKIAQGHQGFDFHTDPKITIEEDLSRRDLTINAIAENAQGARIDPYQGQEDLKKRILRHISPAFIEDPLRIFRIARFRAYLGKFNFIIAPETLKLMQDMVKAHLIDELSDERIWQELAKALNTSHPELFFITLKDIDALPKLLPNLTNNGLQALARTQSISTNPLVLFATVAYEGPYLKKYPKEYEDLHQLIRTYQSKIIQFKEETTTTQLQQLHALDFLRRPERAEHFLQALLAITQNNRTIDLIRTAIQALTTIKRGNLAEEAKAKKQDIKTHIQETEIQVLATFIAQQG